MSRFDAPMLLGKLYIVTIRGSENYSFEYSLEWLQKTALAVRLDPELEPFAGRQYPSSKAIFGLFADASPDRWGRVLMNRRERILSEKERRRPRKLNDSDYLLGVCDATRMGGIRLKSDPEGAFLSDDQETAAPPWTALRALEYAARRFENEESGSD